MMRAVWDSRIPKYVASFPHRESKALDRVGKLGERVARSRARRRTGRMRAGIDWDPRLHEVTASAPYTPYMENGTRFVRAQPMFAPAEDFMRADAGAAFSEAFDPDV